MNMTDSMIEITGNVSNMMLGCVKICQVVCKTVHIC